jgi:hypothetical protein
MRITLEEVSFLASITPLLILAAVTLILAIIL